MSMQFLWKESTSVAYLKKEKSELVRSRRSNGVKSSRA